MSRALIDAQGRLKLTQVPGELRRLGLATPTYREVYNAAVNGLIPATLGRNGRWSVAYTDLGRVARTLSDDRRQKPHNSAEAVQ